MNVLVDNIKKRMEEKGYSMQGLSTAAGCKETTVFDILSGKANNPRIDTLMKVARPLDCTVNDLIYSTEIYLASDNASPIDYEMWDKCQDKIMEISRKRDEYLDSPNFYKAVIELYNYTIEEHMQEPHKEAAKIIMKQATVI